MITCQISAGSSSVVADIESMAFSLATSANWQGFFYQSTIGPKPWCIWAQRMDDTAQELQYVYSKGLAAPPDAYELITVAMPAVAGHTLTYTQLNCMPAVFQTDKGAGGSNVSTGAMPQVRFRLSAVNQTSVTWDIGSGSGYGGTPHNITGAQCVRDLWNLFRSTSTMGKPQVSSYLYNSVGGSQEWQAIMFSHNYTTTSGGTTPAIGSPPVMFVYTMGGMASPPAGSEALAIACPASTFAAITSFNSTFFQPVTCPINVGMR